MEHAPPAELLIGAVLFICFLALVAYVIDVAMDHHDRSGGDPIF
jgi:hypothetical protein